jgi:hypothetical protein
MLRCDDCGRETVGKACDWIALLFDDPEVEGCPKVLPYCPACAVQFTAEEDDD